MKQWLKRGRIEIEWSQFGMEHRVSIDGQIDEGSPLVEFAQRLSDKVVIDLSNVSFVNSLGLREWIRMLEDLNARGIEVTLKRCSESMVHQMCMVVAAKGAAQVTSFFAPFECDSCGYVTSECLDVAAHREEFARREVPDKPCPECEGTMEFNEIPERYLLFLDPE